MYYFAVVRAPGALTNRRQGLLVEIIECIDRLEVDLIAGREKGPKGIFSKNKKNFIAQQDRSFFLTYVLFIYIFMLPCQQLNPTELEEI